MDDSSDTPTSQYSSSPTSTSESSSDYSDSEGTYSLTTTSESEDDVAAETVDAKGITVHENEPPTFKDGRSDNGNGTNSVVGVTPDPAEFLIHPNTPDTYKIKADSSFVLRNGGLTRDTTTINCKTVAARQGELTASPAQTRTAKSSPRFLAFARLRRLPVIRCAAAAYDGAKATKLLGWALAACEAGARAASAPFVRVCSVPMNCVDRGLCKGLDVAEALFPCIAVHPCQMCCGDES